MSEVVAFNDSEAFYISTQSRDWRVAGLTDEAIQEQKKILAKDFELDPEDFSQYSMINAVVAHNRIRAWNLIQDVELRRYLKTSFGKSMYTEVEGRTGQDRLEIQNGLSQALEIPLGIVQAITDGLPSKMPESYFSGDGIHMDYTNPQKHEYHQALLSFLQRHSSAEERREWKVVCMSGIECVEPKKVYIPAGIMPQNIFCCENSQERLDKVRFKRNCRYAELQAVNQDMEDFLRTSPITFDVLSIDPTGQWSKTVESILINTRLAAQGIVFVNVRAQRENIERQQNIEMASKVLDAVYQPSEDQFLSTELLSEISRKMRERVQATKENTSKRPDLGEMRRAAFLQNIVRLVGVSFEMDKVNSILTLDHEDIEVAIKSFIDSFLFFIQDFDLDDEGFDEISLALHLAIRYKFNMVGKNGYSASDFFEYTSTSEGSKGRSQFLTTMVKMHNSQAIDHALNARLVDFLVQSISRILEAQESQQCLSPKISFGIEDTEKQKRRHDNGRPNSRNSSLVSFINDIPVARIKQKNLFQDIERIVDGMYEAHQGKKRESCENTPVPEHQGVGLDRDQD